MRAFFEENLNTMSFTFTMIVLLNAILGILLDSENISNKILIALALLIIGLWAVSHWISHMPFQSEKIYHLINLSCTLILFYLITIFGGLLPLTWTNIVLSGIMYLVLYFINVSRQKQEVERLASKINKQLSEKNRGD